jgi:hypothetical protein
MKVQLKIFGICKINKNWQLGKVQMKLQLLHFFKNIFYYFYDVNQLLKKILKNSCFVQYFCKDLIREKTYLTVWLNPHETCPILWLRSEVTISGLFFVAVKLPW